MDETERRKRVREPPSVPFLWEVKPGVAIKDWKPEASSVKEVFTAPVKLIASVPFAWEESPGKPIPNFSHNSAESVPPNAALINVASSSKYSLASSYGHDSELSCDIVSEDDSYGDTTETTASMDLEAFGFQTDELFSSVPCLLANCLVQSAKISTAIPLQKNSFFETPSSPSSETGSSSTSNYATGSSSPTGASFLECLFPLYPPNSGFLDKSSYSENISSTPLQLTGKHIDHVDNNSAIIGKPPTLGELIMLSRRRSCRRKAVQMRKWDLSRDITTKKAFGCCIFASRSTIIEGLHKRKHLPRLKLV